jgi:hypothetical protein
MVRGQMMQIRRTLNKLRNIQTLLAFIREILFVVSLNMVMHRVLLLLYNAATGANKIPVLILEVLRNEGLGSHGLCKCVHTLHVKQAKKARQFFQKLYK